MQQDLFLRFSHAALRATAVLLIVLTGAQVASATTYDEAAALCKQELTSNRGAQEIKVTLVRRHYQVPYVYGDVDFPDATGVHFRCRVLEEKVTSIRFLVNDPAVAKGRAWAKARPHGTAHQGLELDDAAKAPPPLNPPDPHFQRVP